MDYFERKEEVRQFLEKKAGVQGLIDSGISKIPRIFIHPPEDNEKNSPSDQNGLNLEVPLIDLQGIEGARKKEIVNKVKKAAETWGFFHILNHGIPVHVLEQLLQSVRRFHEQPHEHKKEFYSLDFSRQPGYYSSPDLKKSAPADWKDTLSCNFDVNEPSFDALPHVCR